MRRYQSLCHSTGPAPCLMLFVHSTRIDAFLSISSHCPIGIVVYNVISLGSIMKENPPPRIFVCSPLLIHVVLLRQEPLKCITNSAQEELKRSIGMGMRSESNTWTMRCRRRDEGTRPGMEIEIFRQPGILVIRCRFK